MELVKPSIPPIPWNAEIVRIPKIVTVRTGYRGDVRGYIDTNEYECRYFVRVHWVQDKHPGDIIPQPKEGLNSYPIGIGTNKIQDWWIFPVWKCSKCQGLEFISSEDQLFDHVCKGDR